MDWPVVHRLDVGAVGVEDVGAVVAGVVLALTGCAVVPTARRDRRLVEAGDRLPVGRLEGNMEPLVGPPSSLTKSSSAANQPSPSRIPSPSGASAPA